MPTITRPRSKSIPRLRYAESTRALFSFQRDDQAPDLLTRATIDASHRARHPIHAEVFGNFIEHLGGVIYEGLWAQALLNPNLELIEAADSMPPHWTLQGGAIWAEPGCFSRRCVRLTSPMGNAALERARLFQTVHLPVHRIRAYTLTLFLRAPAGDAHLTVALQKKGIGLLEIPVSISRTGEWQKRKIALTLREGALAKGEACDFVVTHAGGEAVEIDQLELFPGDNVQGMDPDVLKRAKAWKMPLVRYPGGNFVSGYHWPDGIGKREKRPTRRNPAWGGVEPNHFGTDEFMRFCRLVGAKPHLCINAGNGTPDEAADWVRYCNDQDKSTLALLRAANGSVRPYDVRIWEIGNELYGDWQIGHTDAAHNAERFVRFRDAILKADPTIALIATGKADEFDAPGWKRCLDWNTRLLRAAIANNGRAPDYLSIHPLVPLPALTPGATYAQQYESAMAHPALLADTLLPQLSELIASILGPQAKTKIAPTEWGIIVGGDRWWEGPNHDVQAGAVFNALTLNAFLKHSDLVTLANMTAFMHGGGIKKPDGVVIVDPQYWTQLLYTTARPHTPVETRTLGPAQDVPARGGLPAVPNVPDVDVFSALTQDRKMLLVFAVNRHRTESRPLQLDVKGFAAQEIAATILTASDPQARNTITTPDAVAPRPFPVSSWPPSSDRAWRTTLPPHSLVVFQMKRTR